jgi:2-polyprenyl-3-methyl-5-hydroxy-6-metoxy-1,4-benzoquinol methylase
MTQAQAEAYECGLVPEHTDAKFFAQHLAAYAFTRRFVSGKRVLEIGFGEGFGADYLAETAREVVGVDIAPGNIPRAQAKYPRPNLRFALIKGTRLDFPNASFDVVGSFQVIEHIPEPELPVYLGEIRRVLAPDGVAVISTLNLAHNMKPGRPYEKLCYHEKEFTGPELRALLTQTFPRVELHGLYLSPAHHLAQRLKKWGLNRLGPPALNPVARFYERVTVDGYRTRPRVTRAALDLIAVCRVS